ncbi:spermidine synthase [Streptomyces radicis]|uniref:Spermidine synthase-like protein n=1 Tax=Streptomyces radicis TaxID=1750517 RepID=A0A3A9WHP0_9ACTN|nr:fused MFS/spermidine synthase [Streptomyces radicis]RKN12538.1 spermidine synthase-like protein [Streptomyces radicis]RKN27696.1 spermidine synthase-like protein [Streptomyces radicis]
MDERLPVIRDTDFGEARLLPDLDRDGAWLLTMDGTPQSYLDVADPTHLEFEYTRRLAHVLDTAVPEGRAFDVLHLGGGAFTLPRRVAAVHPGARQRVVEADGGLVALVAEHLPLPEGGGIAVERGDALAGLVATDEATVDAVVADVFNGSRVPAHLTTLGCARAAARALRPGGVYAANLADAAPFAFLRSQLATLRAHFAELCLVAEPSVLRGRRLGNVVVAASRRPLDTAGIARRAAADPFPARVVDGEVLDRFIGDAAPVPDDAPLPSPRPPSGAFTIR